MVVATGPEEKQGTFYNSKETNKATFCVSKIHIPSCQSYFSDGDVRFSKGVNLLFLRYYF